MHDLKCRRGLGSGLKRVLVNSVSRINFSVGLIFSEAFPRGGGFARLKRILKKLKSILF